VLLLRKLKRMLCCLSKCCALQHGFDPIMLDGVVATSNRKPPLRNRSGHFRAEENYQDFSMLRSPVVSKRCPSQAFSAIVRMIDMTSLKDLQALYDYGYWANGKLFEVVSQLTPEEFTQSVAGSYGSVRNTIVHVLSAE
jgi:hypothetical protein